MQKVPELDSRAPSENSQQTTRIPEEPLPKLANPRASEPSLTRRFALGMAILAALLAVATIYWPGDSVLEKNYPNVVVVRKADFTVKITEFGELRASDSGTVSAQMEYPIIHLVPEGTIVTKGDVLIRQNAAKYEADLDESMATLRVALANMKKAEKDLEAQRHRLVADIARIEAGVRLNKLTLAELKAKPLPDDLATAQMNLEHAEFTFGTAEKRRDVLAKLVKKGVITTHNIELAELKRLEARSLLQLARFNLKKVSAGATQHELQRADIQLKDSMFALGKEREGMASQLKSYEAAIERERANVERNKKLVKKTKVKLNRAEIRAPRDGLVVFARGKSGRAAEKIQLGVVPFYGQPLIYLPDLSTMVVDSEVNEFDLGKVSLGGSATIRLEAYPGAVFHGKVYKISPLAKVKRGAGGTASGIKVFDVTVKIAEKDPRLKPGLTATVDIIAHHREGAISIPLLAVTSQANEHFVHVARAGEIEKRAVMLGPSNDDRVIVEDGLRPGERVVLDRSLVTR